MIGKKEWPKSPRGRRLSGHEKCIAKRMPKTCNRNSNVSHQAFSRAFFLPYANAVHVCGWRTLRKRIILLPALFSANESFERSWATYRNG